MKLDNARQQAAWHSQQVLDLKSVIERVESDLQEMTESLLRLNEARIQSQESVNEEIASLRRLPIDELQDELVQINLQVAIAERSLTETQLRWQERNRAFEEAQQRHLEGLQRLEEVEEAIKRLDSEIAELKLAETEVRTQIDVLQTRIHPAENELDKADNEQFDLQAKEAQARSALNQAEHYHAQARIALAKRQEALETLRQRIEDDFGLVAFEYAEEVTGPTPLPLEGMVEQLPVVDALAPDTEDALRRQRALLRRMGPINIEAQAEYQAVKTRFEFMVDQVHDLKKAENDVRQVIVELDALMDREFHLTFEKVADEFHHIFTRLFGGGTARLVMTDPDDLTNTGIEIEARLPGRREQGLSLLSGGERSLTAVALIFALLRISPAPFCVLDEVDAMLDEANVGRYRDLLRELSQTTQFIIITHNRNSVQVADVIYGVTMGKDSTSQTVSLKMDEVHRWGQET
jgi:chromosome segregation protein